MDDYKVYAHISPSNKVYIGITKSKKPENRWGASGKGYSTQRLFWRAIQKYGWNNFKHIILLDNLTKEVAIECEKALISKYNTNNASFGYNLTDGGEGISGYKLTEEQRSAMRERMKGHLVSEETRRKIGAANSIALKGKKLSPELCKQISERNKGVSHPHTKEQDRLQSERLKGNKLHLGYKATNEQRQRMSDAHKGKPLTQAQLDNLHKIHQSNKGKPRSEETKEKIRQARLGKKRGPWTDEERQAHKLAIERRKAKISNNGLC